MHRPAAPRSPLFPLHSTHIVEMRLEELGAQHFVLSQHQLEQWEEIDSFVAQKKKRSDMRKNEAAIFKRSHPRPTLIVFCFSPLIESLSVHVCSDLKGRECITGDIEGAELDILEERVEHLRVVEQHLVELLVPDDLL